MKTKYFFILIIIVGTLFSCGSKTKSDTKNEDLKNQIVEKEKETYSSDSLNLDLANDLITVYLAYANEFPQDSLAPEYLFKAAEISMNINKAKHSIDYLTEIENNYKNYDKYVATLFLKAFILENYLKDFENAEKYYSIVVEKYPDHPLAQDAEAAISFLGIDDEELIKMFQQSV